MEDMPFFVQVACDSVELEAVVPITFAHSHGELEAQLSYPSHAAPIEQAFNPILGSLLTFKCKGHPEPRSESAQVVLDSLVHRDSGEPLPVAADPDASLVLVLGVLFDQFPASLPLDASDEVVATIAGWSGLECFVTWMQDPFTDVTFEGIPVGRFVACKPRAFQCRYRGSCGLFLDCRCLGRPVCYRSWQSCLIAVEELLRLLDVDIPPGFEVHIRGGIVSEDPQVFRFHDGAKVTMWAARAAPEPAVLDTPPRDEDSDDEDDADVDDIGRDNANAGDHDAARSRSPRRPGTDSVASHVATGADGRGNQHKPDSIACIRGGMWMPCSVQQACLPCHTVDTSAPRIALTPMSAYPNAPDLLEDRLDSCVHFHLRSMPAVVTVLDSSDGGLRKSVLGAACSVIDRRVKDVHNEVPSPRGPIIRLADHVPQLSFDLTRQQFPVGRHLGEVCDLLNCRPFELWPCLPLGLQLHEATSDAFASGRYEVAGYEPGALQVEIFTLQAEMSAFVMALWWAIATGLPASKQLLSDSLCSLHRAVGDWKFEERDRLALACRAIAQAAEELDIFLWHQAAHVRGHKGNPWNELADRLAKHAIVGGPNLEVHTDIGTWTRSGDLAHLWLAIAAHKQPHMWPRHVGRNMLDTGVHLDGVPEVMCSGRPADASQPLLPDAGRLSWQCVRIASLNVQSLESHGLEAGAHFQGRIGYLRDQFEAIGAQIVSIQEARSARAETYLSGNFIRLCSGADSAGNLGVEAWFARCVQGRGPGFHPEELTVLYWSPRCLCVKIQSRLFQAVFAFIHAPTAQDPTRSAWWEDFRSLLQKLGNSTDVCVVGDFNTRFDREEFGRIGVHTWPSKYPVPDSLYSIMHEQDLWFPSTFEHVHVGVHETWAAPGRQATARLDYVSIPTSWDVGREGSAVVLDLDTAHKSVDHFAVRLDAWVPVRGSKRRRTKVPRFDRDKMATAEGRRVLRRICDAAPLQPWYMDADAHVHAFQGYLFQELVEAFPQPRHCKPGSFLSGATWMLRDHRIWLRKQTMGFRQRAKSLGKVVAWTVWKLGRVWGSAWTCVTARLCGEARKCFGFVAQLRETRQELRRAIRRDRRSWLHSLAVQSANLPVRDVVQRLRPLLRTSGKKQSLRRALPAVRLEDGSLASSVEESTERWIRHFSAVEGGHVCTEKHLLELRHRRLCEKEGDTFEIGSHEMPTRVDLERALQSTQTHKACGPDFIPGELLRYGCGSLSRSLYQLLLKLCVRRDEPLLFKGGTQYYLWKGKGSPSECENSRGILVSSVLGKALHSVLRRKCLPSFRSAASPLQVGGQPRYPVTYAAHVVRMFQSLHRCGSYGLLFVDLKEAFYRVVRPLLTTAVPSDTELAGVFRALQLPQSSFQAFRERACSDSAIAHAGGSEWLQNILTETLECTWFRLPQQDTVVHTTRGTRPGDGLADILFSYVFAEVLVLVRQAIEDCPGHYRVPWHECMRGEVRRVQAGGAAVTLGVHDVTWMDDLCAVAAFDTPGQLLQALECISGVLLDSCLTMGMHPNLKSNKTEIVLDIHGKSSRRLRSALFTESEPSISTTSRHWPEARIRVVGKYKHLGAVIHHRGGIEEEARSRAALAWNAFQKHKRSIFGHAQVAVSDKIMFFKTLVLTNLFHACGTWPVVSLRAQAILQRAYLNMARAILSKHFRGDTTHLCEDRVLALLRLPTVPVWLHFHRLSYLTSFVTLDVPIVWAVAHAEGSWLELVRMSLDWLWQALQDETGTQSWEKAWHNEWRECIVERPGVWKRLLRKAVEHSMRVEVLHEGWQQCRGVLLRRLMRAGGSLIACRDRFQDQTFICGPCQRTFATRQAWSVHAFKVHGRVASSRLLVSGEQCPICLKQYPSNIQLCDHLQRSAFCRVRLVARGFACTPQPGRGSAHGRHSRDFVGVAKQGLGPVWPLEEACPEAQWDCRQSDTWRALVSLLSEHRQCVPQERLWEAYRQALCVECLDSVALQDSVREWAAHVKKLDLDEMSIQASAMHRQVATWLSCNLSAEWLCPQPDSFSVGPCTFRQSEAGLSDLDLDAVRPDSPAVQALCPRLIVCSDAHVSCFQSFSEPCHQVYCWDAAYNDPNWCEHIWDFVRQHPQGTVVFSCAGCPMPGSAPERGASAAQFEASIRHAAVIQDSILLFTELWLQGIAVAALFPRRGDVLEATLKRFCGVTCLQGRDLLLLLSVAEEHIPEALFHFL